MSTVSLRSEVIPPVCIERFEKVMTKGDLDIISFQGKKKKACHIIFSVKKTVGKISHILYDSIERNSLIETYFK